MTSLAHRGLWAEADERNTLAAFRDAFAHGWGVELDVRDLDGALVISHDPPAAGALPFCEVVDAYIEAGTPGRLAVNVKADGLEAMIADAMRAVDPARWFAFDMSVPDTLAHRLELFRESGLVFPDGEDVFRLDSWLMVLVGQRQEAGSFHHMARMLGDERLRTMLATLKASIGTSVAKMPTHKAFLDQYCALPEPK